MRTLWLCGLLLISLTGAHRLDHFPENFVVTKMNDPVTLTCRTNTEGAVEWKFDDDVVGVGLNLSISGVEAPDLGEYTCWRGKEMLSSTYLLPDSVEEVPNISCRAKSYDCIFSCSTDKPYTAVRFGLGQDCREGRKSCDWFISGDGKFPVVLSHSLAPHAEETTMLEVTAEAIFDHSTVLRGNKTFYLRDIVKPDSPQIVRCQDEGVENLKVTIDAPSTWSTPHSFYPLEHQIEYVLRDDGKTGLSSTTLLPKGISKLKARSRDSLVQSAWSEWTPWKNVRTGKKNLCKCKNKAKSCCPELPPGYLDKCKKRRKQKKNKKSQTS
ncbi:interleukin-12 subunit beta [Sebastes fasciatus]|uniref:interleukin-12 subunit beta n=1 Tax=Sebastes fasciatus TaxID=394691 RepID=UPI003D9F02EE